MRKLRISSSRIGVIAAVATLLQNGVACRATAAQEARPEDAAIVRHLNAAITWYKQLATANDSAGQPSDVFYLDSSRSLAKQAVQLAFQSAESEAAMLATDKGGQAAGAGLNLSSQTSGEQQNIAKSAADTAALISQIQAQIDTLNGQIAKATGKKLQQLSSKRESLQEQLDFNKSLAEALQKLSTFITGSARTSRGLQKEIDDLKKSVPDVFAKTPAKAAPTAPSGSSPSAPGGAGLISQVSVLFTMIGDLREVGELMDGADRVANMGRQLQTPLRAQLRTTIQQARQLANQPIPQDPASQEANRQTMISLTARFKQISSATLPLTQEIIVLEEIQGSLGEWKSSIRNGYSRNLQPALFHLAFLLIGIGVVLGISELWLKATLRYVRDARKRHQLLILRRIVTILLMTIVLALAFVSEFSSLATFAGFLTAGIAVALQTVILSVAAYFFLIGRHGVRVGDRVTVSGVTGDVIDVGLVRLSLMELGGAGSDLHPTGRVVVVSNSVLFQGSPFFKQIPGSAYTWHEVAVMLERNGDYSLAERKLLEAVNSVYSQYREDLERENQTLQGLASISVSAPHPQARLQLAESSLELVIRYPVVLHRESEIDNQMTKKVLEVIDSTPELKAAVGAPTIRSADNA